ncbi:hypothetical protein [Brevibacillus sp. NRS-1366]|uniref:hypothetical protein n=1 Tax=Brevibacillus sp. NRS-1366 TaxID=3233899 RepID=UPI003D19616B
MKAEAAVSSQSRPVVVWEGRPQKQNGNVIALPSRNGNEGAGEKESVVQTWKVGPADSPAVVTQVSSGFSRVSGNASAPQASRMSMAA